MLSGHRCGRGKIRNLIWAQTQSSRPTALNLLLTTVSNKEVYFYEADCVVRGDNHTYISEYVTGRQPISQFCCVCVRVVVAWQFNLAFCQLTRDHSLACNVKLFVGSTSKLKYTYCHVM